jgi:hypothetical protein
LKRAAWRRERNWDLTFSTSPRLSNDIDHTSARMIRQARVKLGLRLSRCTIARYRSTPYDAGKKVKGRKRGPSRRALREQAQKPPGRTLKSCGRELNS